MVHNKKAGNRISNGNASLRKIWRKKKAYNECLLRKVRNASVVFLFRFVLFLRERMTRGGAEGEGERESQASSTREAGLSLMRL